MLNLSQRIELEFTNQKSDLWFPEVTDELASRTWNRLQIETGITPKSYGTARILSSSVEAPRVVISTLQGSSPSDESSISVEATQQVWADEYSRYGIRFYTMDELKNTSVLLCLSNAIATIKQIPSLIRTVQTLVRSIHVIRPRDEDYDVSFSEPDIPFSIFVSVPEERIPDDASRVAEAIVHEAMHLQLTLIHRVSPLSTENDEKKYFSPWRREERSAQGLLHALYVFAVIDRFLAQSRVSIDYAAGRRKQIAEDIKRVCFFENSPDLTDLGKILVRRLLDSPQAN